MKLINICSFQIYSEFDSFASDKLKIRLYLEFVPSTLYFSCPGAPDDMSIIIEHDMVLDKYMMNNNNFLRNHPCDTKWLSRMYLSFVL